MKPSLNFFQKDSPQKIGSPALQEDYCPGFFVRPIVSAIFYGMGRFGDAISAMGHFGDRNRVSGGSGGRPEKVVAELSCRRKVLDPVSEFTHRTKLADRADCVPS